MAGEHISIGEARRIALTAQGFDRARPARVKPDHVRTTIRRLGLLQIDFVNVLVPAHYQVIFSRIGPYPKKLLDDVVYRSGDFTEQWAHEASILPIENWPLFRHRMETHRVRPYGFEKFLDGNPAYVERVLEEVRTRGPLTFDDLPLPDDGNHRIAGSWHSSVARAVVEAYFGRGLVAVTGRQANFARTYDLAERVIPSDHFARRMTAEDARRELLRIAARAHGIGTAADLADYYRMPVRDAKPRIAELVEQGDLKEVRVENWREPAFIHREARMPKQISATSLLSPFDPVIWFRPRAARLFDFDYRVEIYMPQEKRRWGYYVLPFLLGDRIVARVDLKADRPARRLLVLSAHLEAGVDSAGVAEPLATELRTMVHWLGLESVVVTRGSAFARKLAKSASFGRGYVSTR